MRADVIREECRRRFGTTPCVRTYKTSGELIEAFDCLNYCPLLKKSLCEEDDEEPR